MKRSSKNRLTPNQAGLFKSDSLFDKIARAVCSAGVLPRKELYEAWEMAKRIRRFYRGGRVVDMACGHGLLAHIMLILDQSSPSALAIDSSIPLSAEKLSLSLVDAWPKLKDKVAYRQMAIEDIKVKPGDLIVSAHACGSLTDLVLDKAIEQKARVAVLPCCHDLKTSDIKSIAAWMEGTLAVDVKRAFRLEAAGYIVRTQTIPDDITPKNRLLMGSCK
ncbi:MAG: methyltransferase [Desulfobacteraceae bacterium]|nr:methyltransferase [Desulfobacteraceae bacterium]